MNVGTCQCERVYITGRNQAEEGRADWRKLHNEWLHDVCCTSKYLIVQIKEDEMGGACGMDKRNA